MKISEVRTTFSNYQTSTKPSFQARETGNQSNGSGILLGSVAAASAAVAGVALYKNHKTGKVLQETLNKLKNTENSLNAAKEKIAETQKKLDEVSVSKDEKPGNIGRKLKKKGKKNFFKVIAE